MSTQNNLASGRPNVIVAGVAGFIGANLAERLIKDYHVIGIDNFSTGKQKNIDLLLQNPNFEFIRHDIKDPLFIVELPELKKFQVNVQGIQTIYNLACPTSPKDHEKLALEILSANSVGVKNLLDLALNYRAVFVHVSSQHIYGQPLNGDALNENYFGSVDLLGPNSAYNEGKRFAETIVMNYRRQFNLDTKIARVFSTYGPKMALNNGRSIPDWILSAMNNWDLVIYGDTHTSNTFCFVDDIVDGLVKLSDTNYNDPMNIGHYEKYCLKAVADKIIELTGATSHVIFQKPTWHAASYHTPDITLAKEKMGWFPLINLDAGLKKTIEFTRANIRLYEI